jgi:hypothetical protein
MLEKAQQSDFNITILSSNIHQRSQHTPLSHFMRDSPRLVWDSEKDRPVVGIFPYLIKEFLISTKIIRFGIFGIMSPDAAFCSTARRQGISFDGYNDSTSKLEFSDYVRVVERTAQRLRTIEKVDIIIMLLHGGHPDDTNLVYKLTPGIIDIIIAGHTHDIYLEAIRPSYFSSGVTYISQAGHNGLYLGKISFGITKTGKVILLTPTNPKSNIIAIDSTTFPKNQFIDDKISLWKKLIKIPNSKYSFDSLLYSGHSGHLFNNHMDILQLSELITNGILQSLNDKIKDGYFPSLDSPIDVYIIPPAAIRDRILPEDDGTFRVQYCDIFSALSFFEPFPVSHFYLSYDSFIRLLNVIPLMRMFYSPMVGLTFSPASLAWEENRWGIPFWNKIKSVSVRGKRVGRNDVIHIACCSYLAKWFWKVKEITKIIDLRPLDKRKVLIQSCDETLLYPNVHEPELFCDYLEKLNTT